MVTTTIFGSLLLLILANVPIAFAVGVSTALGLLTLPHLPLAVVVQRMFTGIDSFPLLAIPLFILTGRLMATGGISERLINLSRALVGFLRGGLSYMNIVASMFFAGITGSATADTASIGSILIPIMVKRGYGRDFSVAVTATSSTIGVLIPPSIPMVIYGVIAGVSIGKLFLGGIVPGLLVTAGLCLVSYILSSRRNYPREERFPLSVILKTVVDAAPPLLTVFIVLGGITSGIFTATEASGIAALYSFLLATVVYRELKLSQIPGIMVEVAAVTGMVAFMIATASSLGWLLASQRVPHLIGTALLGITDNVYVILLLFNIVLLFVGTWLDLSPAMIIFTPILLPIATQLGVDPLHLGIIMVVNLAMGLFTPPVGVCLFVACGIAKIPIAQSVRALLPFFAVMVGILLLITYVPSLVLYLPNLLMD